MLSFKEYNLIIEAPSLIHIDSYRKQDMVMKPAEIDHAHEAAGMNKEYKKISRLGDYDVYHTPNTGIRDFAAYNLVHRKTKQTHLIVLGHKQPNNGFKVQHLVGSGTSNIKAHQFYHHLITYHGINLQSSDLQSHGGMKTWKSLGTQYSDISMKHIRPDGKEIKLNTDDWRKNYGSRRKDTTFIASRI